MFPRKARRLLILNATVFEALPSRASQARRFTATQWVQSVSSYFCRPPTSSQIREYFLPPLTCFFLRNVCCHSQYYPFSTTSPSKIIAATVTQWVPHEALRFRANPNGPYRNTNSNISSDILQCRWARQSTLQVHFRTSPEGELGGKGEYRDKWPP